MKLRRDAPEHLRPDDIYFKLVQLGAGKADRDARQAMAALVLLLINHIGDEDVLDEALEIVRGLPPAGRSAGREPGGGGPS